MQSSEKVESLATALSKFQGEVKNAQGTADNPYFNSKYSPLGEVLNTVRPILAKHGLSVMQMPAGDGQNITCKTLVLHQSGEWIMSDELVLKADRVTAQGAGSAVTYARRYQISAVLGIATEEDDDGNHVSHSKSEKTIVNEIYELAKVKKLTKGKTSKIMHDNFGKTDIKQLDDAELETLKGVLSEL